MTASAGRKDVSLEIWVFVGGWRKGKYVERKWREEVRDGKGGRGRRTPRAVFRRVNVWGEAGEELGVGAVDGIVEEKFLEKNLSC